jgi:signal transduction histidine kinase/streptogramin lyase
MRLALFLALLLGPLLGAHSSPAAAQAPARHEIRPDPSSGAALTPGSQALAHLHHTAWSAKDGLAGNVLDIAQTTDGYLWLGTGSGLVRFDGVRFEAFESLSGEKLPSRGVHSLQAMPDNTLWVGFVEGGAAQVKDGHILRVDLADPFTTASTRRFGLDRAGALWTVDGSQVLRFADGRWTVQDAGIADLPSFHPMELLADPDGNIWISTNQGLFVRSPTRGRFIPVPIRNLGFPGMTVAPDGHVWISDTAMDRGIQRMPAVPDADGEWGDLTRWQSVPGGLSTPFFDRQGGLWYGAANGLVRTRPPAAGAIKAAANERVVPSTGGVSGYYMLRMLQDREGSVWVGTNAGLDRFRATRLSQIPFPEAPAAVAMAVDATGRPWFSAHEQALFRYDPGPGLERMTPGVEGAPTYIEMGADGTRWLGYKSGLREWKDGKVTLLSPPGVAHWNFSIINLHVDVHGVVWMVTNGLGFFRYDHGTWERFHQRPGVPREPPISVGSDPSGTVWLGYLRGRLLRVRGDELKMLTAEDGLRVGTVKAITARGSHVWAGGDTGVQRLDLPGMPAIHVRDGLKLEGITGIVETANGDLWLNGLTGITHLAAEEVRRALGDASHLTTATRYDTLDGLPAFSEQAWPLRTAMQTPDGRLWFSSTNGVVTLDPASLRRNDQAPDVFVQRVETQAGVFRRPQGALALPPGTRDLTVVYTATNLAIPERVRFRYRLVGLDKTWHEADTRRSAFYTNLGPGNYRFEVLASNEDGVWGTRPAVADIAIEPRLTERAGVRAALALAALVAVGLLVRWRTRARAHVEQDRLRARLEERVRVARDLHDTLLQGFLGLVLRLQAVARAATRQEPARTSEELYRLMEVADGLLVEGRDRISDLHRPPVAGPLEQMLGPLGEDLSRHHGMRFDLTVHGNSRALPPGIRDQLGLIVREALFNAYQHSQGTRVAVSIDYATKDFTVRVEDDGVGIPEEVFATGSRRGHWGLPGMQSRATQAGMLVTIESTPGQATRVTVVVPHAVERG